MSTKPTRWEQLGALMTAMIAVILSDSADAVLEVSSGASEVERLGSQFIVLPTDLMRKFRSGQPYCGCLVTIAKDLGVSAAVVSNVFRGRAKSKRIATAILSKLVELEGPQVLDRVGTVNRPYESGFTLEERKQFAYRGRYHGLMAKVTRDMGLARSTVENVLNGFSASTVIVARLRSEMKYADENPPVPSSVKPFSEEARTQFNRGGRYFRAYARVAHALGIKPATVSAVARGDYSSQRIMAALLAEMAQTDLEAASPEAAVLSKEEARRFSFHGKYCGAYSAVGRSLSLDASTVRLQAMGLQVGTNAIKIRKAVREEMARIDRTRGETVHTLSDAERALFKRGGPYFGLYTVVAKKFGLSNARVMEAAASENSSIFLRRALRAEMARVDVELAVKGGAK